MSGPKTVKEALEIWVQADKYLCDPDPGATNPMDCFADASRVLQLAEIEGIPLEKLVPHPEVRQRLKDHAAEFDAEEKIRDDF